MKVNSSSFRMGPSIAPPLTKKRRSSFSSRRRRQTPAAPNRRNSLLLRECGFEHVLAKARVLHHFPLYVMNAQEPEAAAVTRESPIGVFDSGIGGLTVVRALRELLPNESIYYLGDTARVPYGGKSAATVQRYSLEIAELLLGENCKTIVVACNTASALALARLEETLPVSVTGVILPGARAAVAQTRSGHVGVIGTRATIKSGAYERALRSLNPDIRVTARACPLLVPLIEEGWLESPITDEIIMQYL